MTPTLQDRKREVRQMMLTARDALAQDAHQAASRAITARLLALPEYANATAILAYLNFGSEFDTAELIAAILASGRALILPRVDRDRRVLTLHRVDDLRDSVQPGIWGIREPDPQRCPFALQVIEEIPTTSSDRYVDRVVTETNLFVRSQLK
jgi:5-formyltetrahydrofolate cyclo-ligase